jgi:DNA polymerase-3 subunit epsilon
MEPPSVTTLLLAEVYVAMTRGQDSLAIGIETPAVPGKSGIATDSSRPVSLRVLRATAEERAAHAAMLASLEKASGGKLIWPADDAAAKPS